MKKIVALMLLFLTVLTASMLTSCSEKIINVNDTFSGSNTLKVDEPLTPVDPVEKVEVTESKNQEESKISSSVEEDIVETTYYNVTAEEREMLATLVFLESSVCSSKCQRAVASVVFNRLESGKWRKDVNKDGEITLYDIVYYPNAFSPAYLIKDYKPDQNAYAAVDYVIKYGPTVPTEVRYFRTSYDFKWENYSNYCVIDNVYFGYFTNWKQGVW